ncbi:MAG TPA: 3TM-type holin [Gammaproteobacteria bacterium]
MSILGTVANLILPGVFKEVDKAIPDQDLQAKLKASIQTAVLSADVLALESQAGVVKAEAQGESWLQRNWRPITMMVFVGVVFNNYLLAPYLQAMFSWSVKLDTPPDLWELIKLGLGGYLMGRSAEKCVAAWKA